jgi:hypothetical protein
VNRTTVPLIVIALVAAGCRSAGPEEGASGAPALTITTPPNGASVGGTFEVCMEVTGMAIAQAGTLTPGSGHLHVIIDPSDEEAAQIAAGDSIVIPSDENHIHMGDGSTCVSVSASPGPHRLLAVMADGAHTNMNPPVTAVADVEVLAP